MQRLAIGVIAGVLLTMAAALAFLQLGEGYNMLMAACVRVGTVMAVLCLAYREVNRLPAWIWGAVPVLLVLLAVKPRWLLIAIPIIIALAILKPRRHRPV